MNRHFLFSVLFLLTGFIATAQYTVQSKYFVYLQTEPAQPFYIKINGQKLDANTSGYLILPQLKNGDYNLTVGFPDGKSPEQVFDFKIDAKDKGYLIKNFDADGWGLFDLQTMVVQKPLTAEELAKRATAQKKPERPKPQPKPQPEPEPEPKPQPEPQPVAVVPAQPEQQPEPETVKAEPVKAEPVIAEPTAAEPQDTAPVTAAVEQPATVEQPVTEPAPEEADGVSAFTRVLSKAAKDPSLLEKPKPEPQPEPVPQSQPDPSPEAGQLTPSTSKETQEGVTLVYDDRSETGQVDPITIFIPRPKAEADAGPSGESVTAAPEPAVQQQEEKVVEPVAAPESTAATKEEPKTEDKAEAAPVAAGCKSVAGEADFLKLRREMAGKPNDDEMIAEAVKAFKDKCYTTAQIKYLSSMFLSNAGKYNLYEAAAKHIADPGNFASLSGELKDAFYKEKFSKLIP